MSYVLGYFLCKEHATTDRKNGTARERSGEQGQKFYRLQQDVGEALISAQVLVETAGEDCSMSFFVTVRDDGYSRRSPLHPLGHI